MKAPSQVYLHSQPQLWHGGSPPSPEPQCSFWNSYLATYPHPILLLPWRWLAVAGEGPVLIMILLLSFMPNSPRFLLSKSRDEEALQALTWLRADSEVHWEFEQIQDNVRRQVQHVW